MTRQKSTFNLLTTFVLLLLVSCSSKDKMKEEEAKPVVQLSAEELYNNAMDQLEVGRYQEATESFANVGEEHPYSKWAVKAQLMEAYAYYKYMHYQDAISVLERFIKVYPGNKDIAYAFYLRALSYYEQISDVRRDQSVTEQALAALKEVVARFPDTPYARDAKIKIELAYDHLAGKEMEIGRFYLRNKELLAAINRFQTVVKKYEKTTHTQEALYRLVESYLSLGIKDEAIRNAAVLGYNYPSSKWYRYAYNLLNKKHLTGNSEKESWYKKYIPFKGNNAS